MFLFDFFVEFFEFVDVFFGFVFVEDDFGAFEDEFEVVVVVEVEVFFFVCDSDVAEFFEEVFVVVGEEEFV